MLLENAILQIVLPNKTYFLTFTRNFLTLKSNNTLLRQLCVNVTFNEFIYYVTLYLHLYFPCISTGFVCFFLCQLLMHSDSLNGIKALFKSRKCSQETRKIINDFLSCKNTRYFSLMTRQTASPELMRTQRRLRCS